MIAKCIENCFCLFWSIPCLQYFHILVLFPTRALLPLDSLNLFWQGIWRIGSNGLGGIFNENHGKPTFLSAYNMGHSSNNATKFTALETGLYHIIARILHIGCGRWFLVGHLKSKEIDQWSFSKKNWHD